MSTIRTSLAKYLFDLNARKLIAGSFPGKILEDSNHLSSMNSLPSVLYAGFDPTASSLHVGNLLVINNLLRSVQYGCKAIALIGEATASVGDPSGRTTERQITDNAIVQDNATTIHSNLSRIIENFKDIRKPSGTITVLNNREWLSQMSAIDFLRICKPLRVGAMLRTAAVKSRMEGEADNDGISFTEFSYQTLQSIDWLHLAKHHDCFFQMGGSDQLGHLDLGTHYIRKTMDRFAAGVTLPLITDASGNKLGKSTGAPVWLSENITSPFHFFQFWRQLPDVMAERILPLYSLKPIDEVEEILKSHREQLGRWIAQEALANEMTHLVHGIKGLQLATSCSRALFQDSITDLNKLSRTEILMLFGQSLKIKREAVKTMVDLASQSRTDNKPAAKLMSSGAFKVNGIRRSNPEESMDFDAITLSNTKDLTLVCWGKRKFQLIEWI